MNEYQEILQCIAKEINDQEYNRNILIWKIKSIKQEHKELLLLEIATMIQDAMTNHIASRMGILELYTKYTALLRRTEILLAPLNIVSGKYTHRKRLFLHREIMNRLIEIVRENSSTIKDLLAQEIHQIITRHASQALIAHSTDQPSTNTQELGPIRTIPRVSLADQMEGDKDKQQNSKHQSNTNIIEENLLDKSTEITDNSKTFKILSHLLLLVSDDTVLESMIITIYKDRMSKYLSKELDPVSRVAMIIQAPGITKYPKDISLEHRDKVLGVVSSMLISPEHLHHNDIIYLIKHSRYDLIEEIISLSLHSEEQAYIKTIIREALEEYCSKDTYNQILLLRRMEWPLSIVTMIKTFASEILIKYAKESPEKYTATVIVKVQEILMGETKAPEEISAIRTLSKELADTAYFEESLVSLIINCNLRGACIKKTRSFINKISKNWKYSLKRRIDAIIKDLTKTDQIPDTNIYLIYANSFRWPNTLVPLDLKDIPEISKHKQKVKKAKAKERTTIEWIDTVSTVEIEFLSNTEIHQNNTTAKRTKREYKPDSDPEDRTTKRFKSTKGTEGTEDTKNTKNIEDKEHAKTILSMIQYWIVIQIETNTSLTLQRLKEYTEDTYSEHLEPLIKKNILALSSNVIEKGPEYYNTTKWTDLFPVFSIAGTTKKVEHTKRLINLFIDSFISRTLKTQGTKTKESIILDIQEIHPVTESVISKRIDTLLTRGLLAQENDELKYLP
ncbi:hypothetical protein NEOKW01_0207 [Nematocida sp. AWRm80]|nr:hypothetical protein NEOKW01_0207 [Nematocida sp. AWRm80]